MPVLVQTRGLTQAQRREAWHSTVCEALGPLDVTLDKDDQVAGEIVAGHVGSLQVATLHTATAQTIRRTSGLIRRQSDDVYRVVLALSGGQILSQDGRTNQLKPGELAIYDFDRPYDIRYQSGTPLRLIALTLRQEQLPFSRQTISRLTATGIGGETTALLRPVASRIINGLDQHSPAVANRFSNIIVDLLAAAILERVEGQATVEPAARRDVMLFQAQDYIDRHLAEADLNPLRVAAALFVSPRYLHRRFTDTGTTVAGWIRSRRLERCRADLANPALHAQPVSAIGARWGLPDPAHFSRIFRATVGMSPSEYREAQLAD